MRWKNSATSWRAGANEIRLVLFDIYGHTTALMRLMDDPAVKARHLRELFVPDYAPEQLPSIEEAKERAMEHRAAIQDFEKRGS